MIETEFDQWWCGTACVEIAHAREMGIDMPVKYVAEQAWKAAKPKWRPMRDAPMDGRVVLAQLSGSSIPCIMWWSRHEQGWVRVGVRGESSPPLLPPNDRPIAWMELPATFEGDEA